MNSEATADYQALSELELMSQAVNYNTWIWKSIELYVGQCVIEIGAGIGTFTEFLKSKQKVFATDVALNCISTLKQRFLNYANIEIDILDVGKRPDDSIWSTRSVDSIICLNVLEHIKDDVAALANMNALVRPGGNLILMVPAFQCAFGTIDKLDGHFRRYSKSDLMAKLRRAGFDPVKTFFFNSAGLAAWFFTNRIVRSVSTSPTNVRIYDRLFVPWLRVAESILRPPFGQSIIAVAGKA